MLGRVHPQGDAIIGVVGEAGMTHVIVSWLLSLFVGHVPPASISPIWDLILAEGRRGVIWLVLAALSEAAEAVLTSRGGPRGAITALRDYMGGLDAPLLPPPLPVSGMIQAIYL